jgi:hypothetical protein
MDSLPKNLGNKDMKNKCDKSAFYNSKDKCFLDERIKCFFNGFLLKNLGDLY